MWICAKVKTRYTHYSILGEGGPILVCTELGIPYLLRVKKEPVSWKTAHPNMEFPALPPSVTFSTKIKR